MFATLATESGRFDQQRLRNRARAIHKVYECDLPRAQDAAVIGFLNREMPQLDDPFDGRRTLRLARQAALVEAMPFQQALERTRTRILSLGLQFLKNRSDNPDGNWETLWDMAQQREGAAKRPQTAARPSFDTPLLTLSRQEIERNFEHCIRQAIGKNPGWTYEDAWDFLKDTRPVLWVQYVLQRVP